MRLASFILAGESTGISVSSSVACAHRVIYSWANAVHTFSFVLNAKRALSEMPTSSILAMELAVISVRPPVAGAKQVQPVWTTAIFFVARSSVSYKDGWLTVSLVMETGAVKNANIPISPTVGAAHWNNGMGAGTNRVFADSTVRNFDGEEPEGMTSDVLTGEKALVAICHVVCATDWIDVSGA